jgi:hypothetical protein
MLHRAHGFKNEPSGWQERSNFDDPDISGWSAVFTKKMRRYQDAMELLIKVQLRDYTFRTGPTVLVAASNDRLARFTSLVEKRLGQSLVDLVILDYDSGAQNREKIVPAAQR